MALSEFNGEVRLVIRNGLITLMNWIHSNPTADASQAKGVAKTWLDNNAPDYATQSFADKLIDRVLSYGGGTWTGFRDKVLLYYDFLFERLVDSFENENLKTSPEMLSEWLSENGGVPTIVRDASSGWRKGFITSVTITDGTYTVRQVYDPTLVGGRVDQNPLGWEEL